MINATPLANLYGTPYKPEPLNLPAKAAAALVAAGAEATEAMVARVVFTAQIHLRVGDSVEASIAEGVATHLLPS